MKPEVPDISLQSAHFLEIHCQRVSYGGSEVLSSTEIADQNSQL